MRQWQRRWQRSSQHLRIRRAILRGGGAAAFQCCPGQLPSGQWPLVQQWTHSLTFCLCFLFVVVMCHPPILVVVVVGSLSLTSFLWAQENGGPFSDIGLSWEYIFFSLTVCCLLLGL